MKEDNIISKDDIVISVFQENGIYMYNDKDDDLDIDSITFISLIVFIEKRFNIIIPDEMLIESPKTYNQFSEFISRAIGERI